jgi:ferritin-like metal-binding protein YciE
MAEKDLSALFLDTLKDIYYAEKQIYKSLPKMAKAANSDQLRAAFEKHHDETEGQIGRLEQIFDLLGKPARGKKCDAIEGILDEGKEIMEEYKGEPALDAGLLAAGGQDAPCSAAPSHDGAGHGQEPQIKKDD